MAGSVGRDRRGGFKSDWLQRREASRVEEASAERVRARAIVYAEEDAERVRARVLRYEEEDRRRTRLKRLGRAAGVILGSLAGFLLTGYGIYLGVQEFREERADRKDARMVRAWQVLKSATDAKGNVGQITALETLYHGKVNLRKIDLGCSEAQKKSGKGACIFFEDLDLTPKKGGNDKPANLDGAFFTRSKLGRAKFPGANLSNVDFRGAAFSGADLTGAILTGAILNGAILFRANLTGANLGGAKLIEADLTGADLTGADLSGAKLYRTDLRGADLRWANLTGANLSGAKTLTQKQLDSACLSDLDRPPFLNEALDAKTKKRLTAANMRECPNKASQ